MPLRFVLHLLQNRLDLCARLGVGAHEIRQDNANVGKLCFRDRFEQAILTALPETVVNGRSAPRLWNTTNLGFPRLEAEAILVALSERGVHASAGAACSSGSLDPSPVLLAMGVPPDVAHGSVRFSLGRHTTGEELDRAADLIVQVVRRLATGTDGVPPGTGATAS